MDSVFDELIALKQRQPARHWRAASSALAQRRLA